MATVATGKTRYIEIPSTTVKASHCRTNDLNTLNHCAIPTYHLEITETIHVHY